MPKKIKSEKVEKKIESKKLTVLEFEKNVLELAKKGFTSEKIGEELRQQRIHSKDYEKKISEILKEKDLYVNPELKNVQEKLERIKKHYEKNKHDRRAMREKDRVFAHIRKIKKYSKILD